MTFCPRRTFCPATCTSDGAPISWDLATTLGIISKKRSKLLRLTANRNDVLLDWVVVEFWLAEFVVGGGGGADPTVASAVATAREDDTENEDDDGPPFGRTVSMISLIGQLVTDAVTSRSLISLSASSSSRLVSCLMAGSSSSSASSASSRWRPGEGGFCDGDGSGCDGSGCVCLRPEEAAVLPAPELLFFRTSTIAS